MGKVHVIEGTCDEYEIGLVTRVKLCGLKTNRDETKRMEETEEKEVKRTGQRRDGQKESKSK